MKRERVRECCFNMYQTILTEIVNVRISHGFRNEAAVHLSNCIKNFEDQINEIICDGVVNQRGITGDNSTLNEINSSESELNVKRGFNKDVVPEDEPIDVDAEEGIEDISADANHDVKADIANGSANANSIVVETEDMDSDLLPNNLNYLIPGKDWAQYDAHIRNALSTTVVESVASNHMNRASMSIGLDELVEKRQRVVTSNGSHFFGNHHSQRATASDGMYKGDVNNQFYKNYASIIEVQEEITITTTTTTARNTVTNTHPQTFCFRKRLPKSDRESPDIKKRRNSMDDRRLKSENYRVHQSLSTPRTAQREEAMKKRHSNLRRTLASRSELVDPPADRIRTILLNTNPKMHPKNNYYRSLCVLCERNEKHLAHHYSTQHSDREVFIARPRPEIADRMRMQKDTFVLENRRIRGFCFFCEEEKAVPKHHWTTHYLMHTGEKLYYCSACNQDSRIKSEHASCGNRVVSIYDANSIDGSLVAYMCTKCNFMQVKRERIILHVIMEHKSGEAAEGRDFEKVQLVPNMSPVHSKILAEFDFVPAEKRYKCTICSKKLENVQEFANHFDEKHNTPPAQTITYKCFCGEILSLDGCPLTGGFITAHLERHQSDLFLCKVCDGIFYDKNYTQDHLLNEHDDEQFKHEHVKRGRRNAIITETMIRKLVCGVCKTGIKEPNFACATQHFNENHPSDEITLSGFVSTKYSEFTDKTYGTKTTFVGGEKFDLKLK